MTLKGADTSGVDTNGNAFDFTTKLLHLAWHPTENSLACAASNSLYMYYAWRWSWIMYFGWAKLQVLPLAKALLLPSLPTHVEASPFDGDWCCCCSSIKEVLRLLLPGRHASLIIFFHKERCSSILIYIYIYILIFLV